LAVPGKNIFDMGDVGLKNGIITLKVGATKNEEAKMVFLD
jgi:hypothetical protein